MNEAIIKLLCEMVTNEESSSPVKLTSEPDFELGKSYLIRTVTMMYTGRVIKITKFAVTLSDAAWIADSGRYSEALTTGSLSEVEPYPDGVNVTLASMVDFTVWKHALPRDVK